jgi:hypothetical protein
VSAWVDVALGKTVNKPTVYHAVELTDVYETYMKPANDRFNIYFNIDKPPLRDRADCDICFTCDRELCDIKQAALGAMPSQTEALLAAFDTKTIKAMLQTEAFVCAR